MRHVWSHRRHLSMIMNNRGGELCLRVHIKVAGHDYLVSTSSGSGRCFICGREGHIARDCHRRRAAEQNTSRAAPQRQNQEGPEGTGGAQQGGEGEQPGSAGSRREEEGE